MLRLLFIGFFLFSTIGYSQEWKSIYKSDDGMEVFFREHSKNLTWVKTTNIDVDKGGAFNTDKVKGERTELMKFDCENKKVGIIATVEYDNNGEVLYSKQVKEILVDMEYPYPDTMNEFFLGKYCELK